MHGLNRARPASYKAKIMSLVKNFIRARITSTKEYPIQLHRGRLSHTVSKELLIARGTRLISTTPGARIIIMPTSNVAFQLVG